MKGSDSKNKSGAESGTAPGASASADEAAAALQRQLDGGQQTPPAEGAVTTPAALDAPVKTETTEPTPPAVTTPAAPVAERTLNWYVRAGRSVTSPRGVIGPNQQIELSDISLPKPEDQLKQLEYLQEKGILYRAYEPGNEILPPPKNPVDLRAESPKKKK